MREVPRSTIERCAHILGAASAARLALADADARHARGENVAFFLSGGSIFVGPPFPTSAASQDEGRRPSALSVHDETVPHPAHPKGEEGGSSANASRAAMGPLPHVAPEAELSAAWTDEMLTAWANEIVLRRGRYRYAFTEVRARNIVLDVLLDFRDELSKPAGSEPSAACDASDCLDRLWCLERNLCKRALAEPSAQGEKT